MKVAVYLAEGFEEIEAVSIIDVLRRAEISVTVVSVSGKLEVTGAHHIKLVADELIENFRTEDFGMLVLPGGMPGTTNLLACRMLQNQVTDFNNQEKLLGAICAAPMVLGQLGILKNRQATCFPGFEKYLTGASVSAEAVVVSGNVITGRGAGVALAFALKIVEVLKGKSVSDNLAQKMLVP